MACSKSLAARVRQCLSGRGSTPEKNIVEKNIVEKKMFGGIAFLLRGNMLVGVWEHSLIVRLGAEAAERALTEPDVRPFDVTGRPMTGWAMVDPAGLDTDEQLSTWINRATEFVARLPAK